MATIDEIFRKPHAIETLDGDEAAANIDADFDAIWLALQKLKDTVNTNSTTTTTTTTTAGGSDDAFVMAMSGI